MRTPALALVALTVASGLACSSKESPPAGGSPAASTSAPEPKATAAPTGSAAAAAADKPSADRTYLAFQGKIGGSELRLAIEKTGQSLEGIYTRGGEEAALAGAMKDATHFVVHEVVPKGKKPATFEGVFEGAGLEGIWKEPGAKRPHTIKAGPLQPFSTAESSFEESYLGSLGAKIRIRMKLAKAGDKLTGRYRYTKSKDDLVIAGTVSEKGALGLTESTSGGKVTGRFQGVFLQKGLAFGRWSSPDGARTLPFTLRSSDVYPETVALLDKGKIAPQEEYLDKGDNCTVSLLYPVVTGVKGDKALNAALKTAAGGKHDCSDATEELRYESDTTYHVDATRPGRFALSFSFYVYSGGAHGNHSMTCYLADAEKGALTRAEGKLLSADARKKLSALVTAAIQKEQNAEKLSEAGFSADELPIDDATALCVEGTNLLVQYQPYEVAPYSMGAPRAEIPKKDAAPLVAGTPLAPFFE